jgi:tRNA A-37 threonylcarbamoyl transferase component Bud32/cytochrome c-type biogenesis protein CcmH/NrfG
MDDPANRATVPAEMPAPPNPPQDPAVGRIVGERYRLLGQIGQGGMGLIYRAEHTLMKKTVAIKLLHGELGQLGDAVKRFEREAQSASRLNHPNIIAVTDFGRAATGEFYLVMEYVAGISLADALLGEPNRRMSLARALPIVRQMLSALAHAHAQGVVHRDLKPANIMLARSPSGDVDVVKILDFGIAKIMQATGEEGGFTQNAMVFGTPSYMSPEQATAQDVDARADLYSCGVMLFELLTGRKPFVASDVARILAMQVTARPPRFAEVATDLRLPAAVEDVVLRALEKDRDARFQTADEFRAALESLETALVPQAIAALAVSRSRKMWSGARVIGTELRARYDRLPSEFRRFTPIAGVAAVVALLIVVPSLCYRALDFGAGPTTPKAVAPSLEAPLARVEDAMAQGRLVEARTLLLQLLSRHPREGRVHFLLGHLALVERKPSDALVAYQEALRFDAGLRGDAALLLNLRGLIGERDKKVGQSALELIAARVGKPAIPLVAEIAADDSRPEIRAAAREACAKIECRDRLDLVKSYSQDLSQARSCDEKRAAVRGLAETGSARAVDPLKKARATRGALGGLFGGGNDCIRKDIDLALKDLDGV